MNEILHTIQVDVNATVSYVTVYNVRAKYVPMVIKGIMSEYFADDHLEIRVIAQQNKIECEIANVEEVK